MRTFSYPPDIQRYSSGGITNVLRPTLKIDLAVESFFCRTGLDPFVKAVRPQRARVDVVAQVSIKNFLLQVLFEPGIVDRTDDLNAAVQITRHPVRAADINLFITVVREIQDAAVLKKASDDAAHSDIL